MKECPDEGRCHHACVEGTCFRVHHAEPLSGVFPDNQWSAMMRAIVGDPLRRDERSTMIKE